MKTIDRAIALMTLLALVLLTILLTSCQDEAEEVIDPNSQEVITTDSNIADLIARTTLRDGSSDNILDSASCTSIALPVTVVANGLEITIDSQDDLEVLEDIFDELDDDTDVLKFIFPVTVILTDHSEIVATNENELEDLLGDCDMPDVDDDDIECLDFMYPIVINIFDSDNQIADVITFMSDEELYEFFDDLDEEDVVSIEFPITVVLYNGSQIQVNTLNELEDVIEDVEDDCDEDDDNDRDDIDPTEFVDVLTSGDWVISLFFDDEDETLEFSGFVFTFATDGTAIARLGNFEIHGIWSTESDDDELEFSVDFGDTAPFNELKEEWEVVKANDTMIELEEEDDVDERVIFIRPDTDGGETSAIGDILSEGLWKVTSFEDDDDDDDTDEFNGFTFDFAPDGSVTVEGPNGTINGAWSSVSVAGAEKLVLNFGGVDPLSEFNDVWNIDQATENRVELIGEDDDDDEQLIFEKI